MGFCLINNVVVAARAALDSAVSSRSAAVRGDALMYRARAWMALGEPESARVDLRRSPVPRASSL